MSTVSEVDVASEIDMVVHLHIGEGNLDRFVALKGDRRYPLIKYLDGDLTLVSPSIPHERGVDRIDSVVKAVCEELDIDFQSNRSTLYRFPGRDHGIEPDLSYYVANFESLRDIEEEIDLSVEPPPDLTVEAVYTNSLKNSLLVYQELRVPEIWVYRVKARSLEFLQLGTNGEYAPHAVSRSFPFLTPADVLPWATKPHGEPHNRWARRLRDWVHAELAPRYRPAGGAV